MQTAAFTTTQMAALTTRQVAALQTDDIAGFIIAYHDVSAGLQKAKGRLFPFGWAYVLLDRRRTEWVNVNGLGLLPQYRGLGANAMLYTELRDTIAAHTA